MADIGIVRFDNLWRVLLDFGNEVRNAYQDNLITNNRIASGELLNNVTYKVQRKGETFLVILNLAEYWQYVENGRKPGKWPPRKAILDWIKVKPVLPTPDARGNLPTPESLAFLIQRKIGERGTQGTGDLSDAIDAIYSKYIERIDQAILDDFSQAFADVGRILTTNRIGITQPTR